MIPATASKKFPLLVVALAAMMTGCGVGESTTDGAADETLSTSEALRRNDPCATVRCAAGTHCVSKGKAASCVANAQTCSSSADCRTYSNYCDGCACEALSNSNPNPFCGGTTVSCFVDPCMNRVASCQAGKCVLQ